MQFTVLLVCVALIIHCPPCGGFAKKSFFGKAFHLIKNYGNEAMLTVFGINTVIGVRPTCWNFDSNNACREYCLKIKCEHGFCHNVPHWPMNANVCVVVS